MYKSNVMNARVKIILVSLFIIVHVSFGSVLAETEPLGNDSKMMCGPNSLWLALRAYGVYSKLSELSYLTGNDPEYGSSIEMMAFALQESGMQPIIV